VTTATSTSVSKLELEAKKNTGSWHESPVMSPACPVLVPLTALGASVVESCTSVGPAATVGVGYHVAGPWHLYASYSIARVNSDLSADTAGVVRTTSIKFAPQVLILSVGYSF